MSFIIVGLQWFQSWWGIKPGIPEEGSCNFRFIWKHMSTWLSSPYDKYEGRWKVGSFRNYPILISCIVEVLSLLNIHYIMHYEHIRSIHQPNQTTDFQNWYLSTHCLVFDITRIWQGLVSSVSESCNCMGYWVLLLVAWYPTGEA